MEGGNKKSGSSLATELFGAKDSSADSSNSGVFGSIFGPQSKAMGKESVHSSETEKKNDSGSQSWSAKAGFSEKNGVSQGTKGKDVSSYYHHQEEENVQPFHYSSSIYYGGQDVYNPPKTDQSPAFTKFKKDGEQDDSGHASRGNWWQGSLYY